MQYRAEIDGLRAVAVIPVILFHAGFSLFSGGFVGVDVFFVISGYLITSIIAADLDRDKFSLIDFYERRARRLLPALFLVMAVSSLIAWNLLVPRDMEEYARSVVAVSTFTSNMLFAEARDYFDTASELKPLLHSWSLAVEEQYYILFPLLLMAAWSLGQRSILVMLIGISALSFWLAIGGAYTSDESFYYLPTRAWELLLGAMTALYLRKQEIRSNSLATQIIGLTGLAMIAASIVLFDKQTPFPSIYTLLPVMGTVCVLICGRSGTLVAHLLSTKILVGIGLISYSAYLWHQPLLAFLRYRSVSQPSTMFLLLLCMIVFGLAYLSWRYVEKPFRDHQRFSRKLIFGSSLALGMSFILFGQLGKQTAGYANRFDGLEQQALASSTFSPHRSRCHDSPENFRSPAEACVYNIDNPTWAIFGDSHTVELAFALAEKLELRDEGLRHFSLSGCKPFFGVNKIAKARDRICAQWTEDAVRFITSNDAIENVVVSYRMTTATHLDHEGYFPQLPKALSAVDQQTAWQSYIALLETLVASKKNIFLVLQAPEVPIDVQRMVRLANNNPDGNVDGVPRSWWRSRSSYVYDRIDEIPEAVTIVDPADIFCPQMTCRVIDRGTSLYFDDDHMSLDGAARVADKILPTHSRS